MQLQRTPAQATLDSTTTGLQDPENQLAHYTELLHKQTTVASNYQAAQVVGEAPTHYHTDTTHYTPTQLLVLHQRT